jgi:hypothetical protein
VFSFIICCTVPDLSSLTHFSTSPLKYVPSPVIFTLGITSTTICHRNLPPSTAPVPIQALTTSVPQSHKAEVSIFEAERDKSNPTGQVVLQSAQFTHDYTYLNDTVDDLQYQHNCRIPTMVAPCTCPLLLSSSSSC